MTMCYHNYEKKEWVNILEVKMVDWGNLSLFEIGQITGAKNFLSHAAYQSYLTDIWMGEVHPSTPFFLVCSLFYFYTWCIVLTVFTHRFLGLFRIFSSTFACFQPKLFSSLFVLSYLHYRYSLSTTPSLVKRTLI